MSIIFFYKMLYWCLMMEKCAIEDTIERMTGWNSKASLGNLFVSYVRGIITRREVKDTGPGRLFLMVLCPGSVTGDEGFNNRVIRQIRKGTVIGNIFHVTPAFPIERMKDRVVYPVKIQRVHLDFFAQGYIESGRHLNPAPIEKNIVVKALSLIIQGPRDSKCKIEERRVE